MLKIFHIVSLVTLLAFTQASFAQDELTPIRAMVSYHVAGKMSIRPFDVAKDTRISYSFNNGVSQTAIVKISDGTFDYVKSYIDFPAEYENTLLTDAHFVLMGPGYFYSCSPKHVPVGIWREKEVAGGTSKMWIHFDCEGKPIK